MRTWPAGLRRTELSLGHTGIELIIREAKVDHKCKHWGHERPLGFTCEHPTITAGELYVELRRRASDAMRRGQYQHVAKPLALTCAVLAGWLIDERESVDADS